MLFLLCHVVVLWHTISATASHLVVDTHPPNVVVTVGQPATFPLTYSNCNWERLLSFNNPFIIYSSSNNLTTSPRYSVNRTMPNQCDLTIQNVSFSDAGVYQYANGDTYGFEMFVYDQKPKCYVESDNTDATSDFEKGKILLSCSLSYSNNDHKLFPTLKWQTDKKLQRGKERTERVNYFNTISSLIHASNITQINQIICYAQLDGTPTSSKDISVAQNSITYDSQCEIVEAPVRRIKIAGDMNMRLGEKIYCSAEGYPEVKYYWTMDDDDDIQIGEHSTLILSNEGLHVYKCFASNIIQGHIHSISSEKLISVQPDKEIMHSNQAPLAISLVSLLFVVFIGLLIIFRGKILTRYSRITTKAENETINSNDMNAKYSVPGRKTTDLASDSLGGKDDEYVEDDSKINNNIHSDDNVSKPFLSNSSSKSITVVRGSPEPEG